MRTLAKTYQIVDLKIDRILLY